MNRLTMEDLEPGTRVRHPRWDCEGKVRGGEDGRRFITFDGSFVDNEISDEGPVFPADLMIAGGGA
jgi:hypothetical protein